MNQSNSATQEIMHCSTWYIWSLLTGPPHWPQHSATQSEAVTLWMGCGLCSDLWNSWSVQVPSSGPVYLPPAPGPHPSDRAAFGVCFLSQPPPQQAFLGLPSGCSYPSQAHRFYLSAGVKLMSAFLFISTEHFKKIVKMKYSFKIKSKYRIGSRTLKDTSIPWMLKSLV